VVGAAETTAPSGAGAYSGRTAWVRNLETPLRTFLRTETGSAAVLLAGVVAALVWANVDVESYVHVWEKTTLSIHIGDSGLSHDLRYWVNAGLMTLFFFVIGVSRRAASSTWASCVTGGVSRFRSPPASAGC
jgi:hypothetical protein